MNLAAYLARIGVRSDAGEELRPDLPLLRHIVYRHAVSIPFENLDPFRGVPVSLALLDVERKLVEQQRGGWCFEHNLLLGEALRALGFTVHDLAARVLWGRDREARTPRTHRLLEVEVEGGAWLADVGFGGLSLTDVLDLESRVPQQTPHEIFRLSTQEEDLLLEARAGSGEDSKWMPMYRFNRARQWPVDFEAANFQLSRDPQSPFVQRLALALPTPDGRHALRDRELTWRGRDGAHTQRRLEDAEWAGVIRDVFGIDPGLDGLRERLHRLR